MTRPIPQVHTEWGPQPAYIEAPCGNRAIWDTPSQIGYRCQTCFAMLGSVGMPKECSDLMEGN